jgi:hypothetical protein
MTTVPPSRSVVPHPLPDPTREAGASGRAGRRPAAGVVHGGFHLARSPVRHPRVSPRVEQVGDQCAQENDYRGDGAGPITTG